MTMHYPDAGNPFSTRRTRPGAIVFQFDEGECETVLIDRLREFNWRAQIIGPHGSGKSTLLETLRPALDAAGREVQPITLRQGECALPITRTAWRSFSPDTLLAIDGYEQLGRCTRWRLERHCRRCDIGLLITSHRDLGLPMLYRTNPGLNRAMAIVGQLLPPGNAAIQEKDIEAAWRQNHGNLRETLFALYDLFEQRRGASR